MIYRVVLDGIDILDYQDKTLTLISPTLELEVNNAGSLEFVMPPTHQYYDAVHMFTSTIEVYEDDDLIWFGRPVDETIDFYKQKKIYCEGPFSFFNDTIQRPEKHDSISIHTFFRNVIDNHNGQVTNFDRKFEVGQITVDETFGYRKLNYESSHDVIQNMCLDTNDGYLFFRREDGVNYIDWFAEMPFSCNQSIEFGVNLLNYRSTFSGGDYATCVLPLGKTQKDTGEPLTIKSVNSGSDILTSIAAVDYGNIIKVQQYSDIDDASKLLEEAQKYLENSQFNSLVIECSAADLHSLIPEKEIFKLGQNVHCISNPHLVDRDFPISKMTINLDSAAKTITLGVMKKKTLTRIYKEETDSSDSYSDSGGYLEGIIEDPLGDLWEIILPENPEDPITRVKAPTHIEVSKPPNKTEYYLGETIDYSGISVNIWCEDKIWTNPPRYLDGKAPYSELSFPQTKILTSYEDSDNTGSSFAIFVPVVWYYKGQKYQTTTVLTVINQTSGGGSGGNGGGSGVSGNLKLGTITVPYQYGGSIIVWQNYFLPTNANEAGKIYPKPIDRELIIQNPAYAVMIRTTNNGIPYYNLYIISASETAFFIQGHTNNMNDIQDTDKVYVVSQYDRLITYSGSNSYYHQVTRHGLTFYYSSISFVSNDVQFLYDGHYSIDLGRYGGPEPFTKGYTSDWLFEMMYQLLTKNTSFNYGNGGR